MLEVVTSAGCGIYFHKLKIKNSVCPISWCFQYNSARKKIGWVITWVLFNPFLMWLWIFHKAKQNLKHSFTLWQIVSWFLKQWSSMGKLANISDLAFLVWCERNALFLHKPEYVLNLIFMHMFFFWYKFSLLTVCLS